MREELPGALIGRGTVGGLRLLLMDLMSARSLLAISIDIPQK